MRLDGWESRLSLLVEEARHRPYALGEHDCFRLACRAVEALTGVDRWTPHAGYRTRREALVALASHGSTFEDSMDRVLDCPRAAVADACRGDIVCVQSADGEKHLGVVTGRDAAFLGPEGIRWVAVSACVAAWRVG